MTGSTACPTVVSEIAANELCIGCGACAAVCPARRLRMAWSERGTIEVCDDGSECISGCKRCLTACPFADGNDNEDVLAKGLFGQERGIDHRPETGYFLKCFASYSKKGEQRSKGASGGLATWFLTELLESGQVDRVACVTGCPGPRPLFKYAVCDAAEQVEAAAKSAYYPVEMSEVIRSIRESEGRYAIIGLPCFVKAVRLACQGDRRLRERIRSVAGLVCGQGTSAFFAEYCAALAGVAEPENLARVSFRGKDPDRPATDLRLDFLPLNLSAGPSSVHWSKGPGEAWSGRWFTGNPCLYCDDVFAECADIVFMDAWLPKYIADWRGTNLVVVRSSAALAVLDAGASSGTIQLDEIDVRAVIRSQRWQVRDKKGAIAHRLWLAQKAGRKVPVKRIGPKTARSFFDRWSSEREAAASETGAARWRQSRRSEDAPAEMRRIMRGSIFSRLMCMACFAVKAFRVIFRRMDWS